MKQQKYYNLNFDVRLISQLAQELNLHEKIVEILFSRGYTTKESILKFLSPSEEDFHNPFLLNGMNEAINTIKDAIKLNKKILVFGDYDVDGMSATAILFKAFRKLNVLVDYFLPNRFVDGYGLTNDVLDKIKAKFNPNLIITVDCGISCKNEVEYAKSLGIEMIVTDHHEPPEEIPNCIVIDAKIEGQNYPFKELCGTGVALKLSQALLGFSESEEFLPIAAVATIADIVSLTDENRAIVSLGLKNFERDMPLGYKYLFQQNKLKVKNLFSTDIAFKIAPKLNSSGRMGDAVDSLKLIISENVNEIKQQLNKINAYNLKRQTVCNECYDDCLKMLSDKDMSTERAIILNNKNWDHGILGIVAARLVDKFNRPTFLFSEDEGILKGSARSIPDINVHEILSDLGDILVTFGGHKMAAGLTLDKENYSNFCKRVNSFIFTHISPDVFKPINYYDIEMDINELDEKFLQDLKKLEPFGLNNANPLIKTSSKNAIVTPLKSNINHFTISFDKKLELIYFNCSENYFNLKYSENKSFIYELQYEKVRGMYKGIVKNFEGGYKLDKTFKENLNAIVLNQLCYNKNSNLKINNYSENDIVNFIAESKHNPFGMIFVANSLQTYNDFINKYDLTSFYKKFIFDKYAIGGFNAVCIYPTELKLFKDYSKIVFLDQVLDKCYLSAIAEVSKAEIFIPTNKKVDIELFQNLNLDRKYIGVFYKNLKTLSNNVYINMLHLYNKIMKLGKLSFKNFYVYLLIFQELEFIKIDKTEGFKIIVLDANKKDLSNSILYNKLKFNQQIFKKDCK